jgi:hypothetical protein
MNPVIINAYSLRGSTASDKKINLKKYILKKKG